MRAGIFAKTFPGDTPAAVLGAARRAGYRSVQYNMACSGLGALPGAIPDAAIDSIKLASAETGVEIAALSATYNMAHPDAQARGQGRRGFAAIAAAAQAIGCGLVTVCSGSLDPLDQWRRHRDNGGAAAWREMCDEFERIVPVAERHRVLIGVEPERANIVESAPKARRLLDLFPSGPLRIVFDAANLFEAEDAPRAAAIIDEALASLGPDIALAHAKDRRADGAFAAVGKGIVDWPRTIAGLRRAGYDGALVTHGLAAEEAAGAAAFLRARIAEPAP